MAHLAPVLPCSEKRNTSFKEQMRRVLKLHTHNSSIVSSLYRLTPLEIVHSNFIVMNNICVGFERAGYRFNTHYTVQRAALVINSQKRISTTDFNGICERAACDSWLSKVEQLMVQTNFLGPPGVRMMWPVNVLGALICTDVNCVLGGTDPLISLICESFSR